MSAVEFTLRGVPEVRELLDSLSGRELVNRTRRGTRAGAGVMRKDLRARVRSGRYPRSFREIRTRSTTHGGASGRSPATRVGPVSPLHVIFEGGASRHRIAPRRGSVLANPEEGFLAFGPVSHPGMAARPLTTPAFEATKDAAADAAMDTILEGLR